MNSYTRIIVIPFAFVAFLLLACSTDWEGITDQARGERPPATSTPDLSAAAPKPLPALLKVPPPPTSEPVLSSELVGMSTEEQLARVIAPVRDLRDLALRLSPGVDEIPVVVNRETPDYEVGDQETFWAHDLDSNSNFQITAELIHKTDVAYAWVEEDRASARDSIIRSVDRFSQQSYPAATAFFGSEWKPGVDNDPRMHVLHAYGLGGGIAGYYSSADEYSRLARDFSNEKEIFYINLDWLNSSRNFEYYETVLAHEFQHMIHWHKDRNEETWVNEGLSEFAQEVAGYDPDTLFASAFAGSPDTQLNTWGESQGDNGEHYGSAYLFMAYFSQRFGAELTKALVAHPANGIRGIDAVLAAAGLGSEIGLGFDTVFADWVVANYVDDPNALGRDGVFGYRNFTQDAPVVDQTYDHYPTDIRRATVHNYATDYVLLNGSDDITIHFTGQKSTHLADMQPQSGQYAWWSNRGDDFDTRLTRTFDLRNVAPDTPVAMDVAMWWEIEEDYDYGYVLASRDGRKWDVLAGKRATTENLGGSAFGAGYTSKSANNGEGPEWVVERFDLSPYVGSEIEVRFEYVTDDAVNTSGWFVDDITIPALGYIGNFEGGNDGWESEGWLLTNNRLAQRWLLQVLSFEDNRLAAVERYPVDEMGKARIDIDNLGNGKTAVLAISALAPVTTEPAEYEFQILR